MKLHMIQAMPIGREVNLDQIPQFPLSASQNLGDHIEQRP